MHGRAPAALVVGLVVALFTLLPPPDGPVEASSVTATAAAAPAAVVSTVEPDAPPVTVSDFYPEDNDLSDCLGFVERPGCGSEARGGRGQTLAFIALGVGLALVFWRVSVGVRKNRRS